MPVAITPPQTHVALKDSVLFAPLKLGHLSLKHRIIQVRSHRVHPPTRATGTATYRGLIGPQHAHAM